MAHARQMNEEAVINDEITYAPGTVILEDCMIGPFILIPGLLKHY